MIFGSGDGSVGASFAALMAFSALHWLHLLGSGNRYSTHDALSEVAFLSCGVVGVLCVFLGVFAHFHRSFRVADGDNSFKFFLVGKNQFLLLRFLLPIPAATGLRLNRRASRSESPQQGIHRTFSCRTPV